MTQKNLGRQFTKSWRDLFRLYDMLRHNFPEQAI